MIRGKLRYVSADSQAVNALTDFNAVNPLRMARFRSEGGCDWHLTRVGGTEPLTEHTDHACMTDAWNDFAYCVTYPDDYPEQRKALVA